jgi:hypothetical protein
MQRRILQTGILSIFILVLFVSCPPISCGCQPSLLGNLSIDSYYNSVQRGSSTQISLMVSNVYDESAWPLQFVIRPAYPPSQTNTLPAGINVDLPTITKIAPKGMLTIKADQTLPIGTQQLVVYAISSTSQETSNYAYLELKVTDKP